MIYANWKEFFEKDKSIIHINGFVTDLSRGKDLAQSFNMAITVEELYHHFKARLMDEVVAKQTWYIKGHNGIDVLEIPLKDKG